ncbi:hypothetical protein AAY473_005921, partial [Plecturocebus cupreus]
MLGHRQNNRTSQKSALATRVAPLPGISRSVGNKNSSESLGYMQRFVTQIGSLSVAQPGVQWVWSWLTATLTSLGSGDSHTSAPQVAGTTNACHHTRLIFIYLFVDMGFFHVAHAGLKFLDSREAPASASQGAEVTVETGFHHVGLAGLELLTSGDPPASASQSAGLH